MCGITGIFSLDCNIDKQMVIDMSQLIKHRGPDGFGTFFDENIGLGHRRLKIIDLSDKGHQPMFSDDGNICIVYNGEIYNYIELRKKLIERGYSFNSSSDTEVIVKSFQEYGEDCLKLFNGMFSFAIWDRKEKQLFCARDRFGEKPFYYHNDGNTFVFSSEIKSILLYLKRIKEGYGVNYSILKEYLVNGIMDHTNNTFFEDVKQLRPGHYLKVSKDSFVIKKYYDLNSSKLDSNSTKIFLRKLLMSVKLRLRSDVEVGALLSGGLDSSSIVFLTDRLRKYSSNGFKEKFRTLTAGSKVKDYDESNFAKLLINQLNVDNEIVYPDGDDILKDLKKIIWHHDEPVLGSSMYSHWKLMQKASDKNITVLLHGQGADEFLLGYDYIKPYYLAHLLLNFRIKKFISSVNKFSTSRKVSKKSLIFSSLLKLLPNKIIKDFKGKFQGYTDFFINLPSLKENTIPSINKDMVMSKSYSDIYSTNMPYILHYEDRNSMAFSIESRAPFLDNNLASLMFSLPLSSKISDKFDKVIFRKAMDKYLPKEILSREEKMGFTTPTDYWLRKSSRDKISKLINSDRFKSREFFNHKKIKRAFSDYVDNKNIYFNRNIIWRSICVDLWLRIFFDKKESLKGGSI